MRTKFKALHGHLPERASFDLVPAALARWNTALAVKNEASEDNTISIYDVIGYDPWTGSGTTAKRIAAALRTIGAEKDIIVNINSPGGDLFEGVAIYNLLRDHKGKVTTRVVGLAASAASLIAMAGDSIQIARAGFMMIHNVWVMAIGNRNDLRDAADQLEVFDAALADVYAVRTKRDQKEVATLMDKETWFSGSQAIEGGFADELLPADQVEEKEDDAAAARGALKRECVRGGLTFAQRRAPARPSSAPSPAARGIELRTFTLDSVKVERREDGKGFRIDGHAAVFDKLSDDLGGFVEQIRPGAFAAAIGKDDVRALFNHDENFVLGRNKAGTMVLAEDGVGLKASIEAPDTQWARDLAVSIERGDVDQMSFAFGVTKEDQEWARGDDGRWVRTINNVSRLWDVSIVTYPAYPQTDAAVRALRIAESETAESEQARRVAQEKAEKDKEQSDELDACRRAQVERLAEIVL